MRSVTVLVALAATAVTARIQNYTSSLNMTIDPNTVAQQQRAVWCQAQTNTCQALCDANTNENGCNQANLSYECTCSANNSAPALQYYTQTLPTFICQQLFSQCNAENAGSQDAQADCINNIQKKCGTINPPTAKSGGDSSSTTTASTSAPTTTAAGATSESQSASHVASSSAQSASHPGLAGPTMAPGSTGAVAAAAVGILAYLL